jgi:hypothetical protein
MYPLLMKTISTKWLPYDKFFAERKNRIMAFLNVTGDNQIDPELMNAIAKAEAENNEANKQEADDQEAEKEKKPEETPEEQARKAAAEGEKKSLERGLQTLEILFPGAGWDKLSTYPDLYPYFANVFDLRRSFVYIAPTDCLQQIFILMRMIEEFFYGLRYVSFGTIIGQNGNPEDIEESFKELINEWHYFFEFSMEKEYLPRMTEYIRILEGSPDEWNTPYTKKIISDLHWIKRLYYLPFYKFDSHTPPPFQKKDITPVYSEIKKLRHYLAAVASGIEAGTRAGGAEEKVHCDGIKNPWDPYVFQVANPLSKRMDALLAVKRRNNASLVYFTLAAVTVLDYLVNSEDSWAYAEPSPLFRSVDGKGVRPLTGVDTRIDADAVFIAALKKRQAAAQASQ